MILHKNLYKIGVRLKVQRFCILGLMVSNIIENEEQVNKNIFFNPQISQTRLSKMPRCGAIARHERAGYMDYFNHLNDDAKCVGLNSQPLKSMGVRPDIHAFHLVRF